VDSVENPQKWLLLILSWLIWISGLYCLMNFGFFAELGALTAIAIRGDLQEIPLEKFKDKKISDLEVSEIDDGFYEFLID